MDHSEDFPTIFQPDDFEELDRHIGNGGYGHVYCRRLRCNGTLVAEKRTKEAITKIEHW